MAVDPSIDPDRYAVQRVDVRGVDLAFVHENPGGAGPLVLVHGWPESKRIWWKVIEPLAALGFAVVAPDLRGFGDSGVGPDGIHDVPTHSRDIHALLHGALGYDTAVLVGGDLGGPVIQDLALRFAGFATRMVLFNSPLPYDRAGMAGMRSRPAQEASDYFVRQGTDADALAAELATPQARQWYISTFYTSRFWAHPGWFLDAGVSPGPVGSAPVVDFHTEPFADAAHLRASFGAYESTFSESARSELPMMARNPDIEALLLFGTSDHVLYPDFDRMAAVVFPNHVGPFLLRDCGHFVPWEAPTQLVSGIRAFCRDLL
jgi:pimeloyl-ACP methyl ester carboxylesterase